MNNIQIEPCQGLLINLVRDVKNDQFFVAIYWIIFHLDYMQI